MFRKNLPRPSRVLGNRWTAGFKMQCSPRRVFGNAYWVSSDDPERGHPCLCHLDLEDPDSPNVKSTFSQNTFSFLPMHFIIPTKVEFVE